MKNSVWNNVNDQIYLILTRRPLSQKPPSACRKMYGLQREVFQQVEGHNPWGVPLWVGREVPKWTFEQVRIVT